jgi:hypothetical protein
VTRKAPVLRIALTAAFLVLGLALAPGALAGKGGKAGGGTTGGSGGTTGGSGGSLTLVVLDSTDGLPHWGNHVTFNVSTTASQPYVTLNCYQNGAWVLSGTRGFFAGYVWGQVFALSWAGGGAADCTATLSSSSSGGKSTTLGTLGFHVYA